ncbi:collagen alpha-2(I) chain-like [Sycon ciliatum]|uniref:collagen alpha-2(I) chain-like n=1 Tax=Sycon ciliatum TaxID=27933 RepID=UPI0031F643B2
MESCIKRHRCPGDDLDIFSDSIGHAGTERRSCEGVVSTRFPHGTHSCSIEEEDERLTHRDVEKLKYEKADESKVEDVENRSTCYTGQAIATDELHVKTDGSVSMDANLDMNEHSICSFAYDDSSLTCAVPAGWVKNEIRQSSSRLHHDIDAVRKMEGPHGDRGLGWLSGGGMPLNSIGRNGDFYLDATTLIVYKKFSSKWMAFGQLHGSRGEDGPRGERGSIGPEGETGIRGANGQGGERGQKGDQEIPGPEGPRGEVGECGLVGPEGEIGPRGEDGQDGPQGERGLQGDQGAVGPVGPQGTISATGPPGNRGLVGPQGIICPGPSGTRGRNQIRTYPIHFIYYLTFRETPTSTYTLILADLNPSTG